MTTTVNPLDLLSLLELPGVGRKTAQRLLGSQPPSHFSEDYWQELVASSKNLPRLTLPEWRKFERARDAMTERIEKCDALGLRLLTFWDEDFPEELRVIPDAPLILYVKGNASILRHSLRFAVIGTREPSEYGTRWERRACEVLVEKGVCIVSGLAIGCDSVAHQAAVDFGGPTIAVLANGLDRVYPAQNRELAQRILDGGGALVSEYPPYSKVQRTFFVERDRLQSGLCAGIIVVETDVSGGTMHTVGFAEKQKRRIGVLNHPQKYREAPKSRGNQSILNKRQGVPLFVLDDLLEFIGHPRTLEADAPQGNALESDPAPSGQMDFLGEME